MNGYTGKLLRINLTEGQISTEALDADQACKFIGGRGLGVWYLSQEVDPSVDPLSPDNKVLLATGPLTGTPVPTAARYMVVTKSPLSGTIASSNSGGFWGPELKFAGYDMIIVEGKSPKPCYITIRDDQVQIHDAAEHWGRLVAETTDALIEKFGDPRARVLTIGPAGERLSPIAAVINERWRAAGRSGVGAVLGSKNLKAIVVRGTGKAQSADPQKTKEVAKALQKRIKDNAITGQGLPTYGTAVLVNIVNETGVYPARNFQEAYFPTADQASGEALAEKHLTGTEAGYRCPIACGRKTCVDGVDGGGPEYETLWAFSADCGVDDLTAVIKANRWCNEYGLDTISAGSTIACAMELYQKGILKDSDLGGGPALQFGSGEAIVEWTRRMGAGEGLGAKLAMGSYRFAESFGAPELSMSVKKLELPAYDPRGIQGHGLQYATTNRGGCHVRGYLIAPELLGVPEKLDPTLTEGKAVWVKTFQDLTAVIDSLGLCLFTSFVYTADDYRDLFNVVVGTDLSTEQMMTAGERIWNLERTFNLKAGIEADQDTLPKRLLTEPIPAGPSKGQVHRLGDMLPEYYSLRGWGEDGVPTKAKLAQLSLA